MPDEGLVLRLLEQVVESGCTPEVVCADYPELLMEVRERLGRLGRVREELDALFPGSEPRLAEVPESHRYQAARAAARAGCGEGQDAALLDDASRAGLRRQALAWLRADRDALAVQHTGTSGKRRKPVVWFLRVWLHDAALAGVRDQEGLARLDADERGQWQALWNGLKRVAVGETIPIFESARTYAARREWGPAAESYARVLALSPTDDGHAWFEFAAVQLLSGDRAGYRRACAWMLARSPAVPGLRPYHVARACTLAPGALSNPAQPARLSENELQSNKTEFWSLTEQAALLHRAGRSREAIPLLEQSLEADKRPGTQVVNWLWLALAHQRLGRAEEARRWLDKARQWLDQFEGGMPANADALGLHLHNWLEAHALRREAEDLLRPLPVGSDPRSLGQLPSSTWPGQMVIGSLRPRAGLSLLGDASRTGSGLEAIR